jgi:hypothetical protein
MNMFCTNVFLRRVEQRDRHLKVVGGQSARVWGRGGLQTVIYVRAPAPNNLSKCSFTVATAEARATATLQGTQHSARADLPPRSHKASVLRIVCQSSLTHATVTIHPPEAAAGSSTVDPLKPLDCSAPAIAMRAGLFLLVALGSLTIASAQQSECEHLV